jgi:hypothetical protein
VDKNLATPLAVQLTQRLLNFMLMIFRVFPSSISKPSYVTGRTVETNIIEFYVTDFQSISIIDSKPSYSIGRTVETMSTEIYFYWFSEYFHDRVQSATQQELVPGVQVSYQTLCI